MKGWILYVEVKKRKKERYINAMEQYRTHLLTLGVTQWIKASAGCCTLHFDLCT